MYINITLILKPFNITYSTEVRSVLGGTGNQVGNRLGGLTTGLGNDSDVLSLGRVLFLTSLLQGNADTTSSGVDTNRLDE
jgi:hypothetical protein